MSIQQIGSMHSLSRRFSIMITGILLIFFSGAQAGNPPVFPKDLAIFGEDISLQAKPIDPANPVNPVNPVNPANLIFQAKRLLFDPSGDSPLRKDHLNRSMPVLQPA